MLQHDLRAALSEMLGGLSQLLARTRESETRSGLEALRGLSEEMGRLISLLSPDPRALSHQPPELRLDAFLASVARRWEAAAQARGIRFTLEVSHDLPTSLHLDRLALERLLSNLLGNALAHGAQSAVWLRFGLEQGSRFTLTVRDDGPGFPDTTLNDHAAGEASSAPFAPSRHASGLGLSICREITEALDGTMCVSNPADGGAEIRIALPVTPVRSGQPGTETACLDHLPDLTGWTTLVADDSASGRAIFEHLLRAMGAQVVALSDGADAQEKLLGAPYDLAVIDIEMPGLSGLEVMRALRRSDRDWARLPIIACSGHILQSERTAMRSAGADVILAKPLIGVMPILRAITEIADARQPASRICSPNDDLLIARLMARTGRSLAELLGDTCTEDLRAVQSALAKAVAEQDRATLSCQSHKLAAVAGAIGDDILTR
ncbi:hypothetical protein TP2_14890 [Thioclava pacifica DSM 10166]|uniref:histidine kinase n=2 Tax=Thioclava pacifica TaxID=285109 RepID=A0A074J3P0_9RHOB|nr:hypothetical protein TP2_14890 [Thioclava pacifica DSM 10166]